MILSYEDYDYEITAEELVEALAHAICEKEWIECAISRGAGEKSDYKLNLKTVEFMVREFNLYDDEDVIETYIDLIKDYIQERYLR